MVSAAVAGTTFRPARSYTTLWDVTPRSLTAKNHGPPRSAITASIASQFRTKRVSQSQVDRSRLPAIQKTLRPASRSPGGDRGNPVWVRDTKRTLGNEWVPHVHRVAPSMRKRLPQAESALVDVEPKVVRVWCQPPGEVLRSRAQELVAHRGVDLLLL